MSDSIFVVSHKHRIPFGFDCDDEPFSVIRAFSTYQKAFKYIQIKHPDIYRDTCRIFRNKNDTDIYMIREVHFD